jgi:hypothetical protein
MHDPFKAVICEHDTRSGLLLASCCNVCHGGPVPWYYLLASWFQVQLHLGELLITVWLSQSISSNMHIIDFSYQVDRVN